MKISFRQKRAVSLLLVVVLLVTLFTSAIATSDAATATLSYSFANSTAGYAEGTITLSGDSGTYWLYWADDSSAIDGFYPIAKLTLSGSSKTHSMYRQTAIPAGATKLVAFQSSSEPSSKAVSSAAAVFNIPSSKQLGRTSQQRRYRFMSYSDVHFDALYRSYKYDETHWSHTLQTAADRGVDFMVGSGDYINNNIDYPEPWVDEWHRYEKILAESDYCNPVYEAIGNHELWHSVNEGTTTFIQETGLEGSNGTSSTPYFEKNINGDHFIFMALEGGFYPDRVNEFTNTQLDWLQGLLSKYSGDGGNIYIIEHSLFYKYGAGDRTDGEPYYDIPLSDSYQTNTRLKSLLETYKDAIFITGHTHIAFDEQYNFSDNNGSSAQMIHNSSIGGVRHISNGALTHDYAEDEAEAYIVDVFDNSIIFQGANVYYNKIDPNCTYILKTSQQIAGGEVPTQGTTAPNPTVQSTTAAQATTAQPTTAQSTTVQPTTSFTGTKTAYYLKGQFNSWGTSNPFYTTQDSDIISLTMNLSAGTYEFKINTGSTWYGNTGVIEDTTKKTSNGGWIMSSTESKNCTLKATGGTYTFTFTLSTKKLNVLYNSGTTSKKLIAPVGSSKTYYLFGYINGADYGCESDYQTMGIYKFSGGKLTATFSQNSYVAVKEENNAAWYMTNGYQGQVTSVRLYNTNNLGTDADKLYVPAGKVIFTLTENSDGSLTLSYVKDNPTTAAATTVAPSTAAPTTLAPTTIAPTTIAPTTAAPTTKPVESFVYGDADGDGKVTIIDATKIQRHLAEYSPRITGVRLIAADVTGSGGVDIMDVTTIQRYLAKFIEIFPAQQQATEPTTVQPTTVQPTTVQPTTVQPTTVNGHTDAEITALMNTVSANLTKYYRYSSYDCYMAAKKEYRADLALKNAGNTSQVDYDKLNSLHSALLGIVNTSNVDSTSTSKTVYFENTNGWSTVKAYVWGNQGAGAPVAWPGASMTSVGTNEYGHKIYSITVTDPRYKNVIFNDGNSQQTQDLRIYRDSLAFYLSDSSSPFYCKGYIFKSSYVN